MQALWWALGFSCLPAIERLVAIQNYVCWKLSYFFKKCLNMCEMGLQKRGTQQEFTPTLEFFFAFLQELNLSRAKSVYINIGGSTNPHLSNSLHWHLSGANRSANAASVWYRGS